jgi:hypothetical protein
MGLFAIVAYHPREGMEAELREAIRDHLEVLGAEGLVTSRAPTSCAPRTALTSKSSNGSPRLDRRRPPHPAGGALWARFERACEYRRLCDVVESRELFAGFEGVEVEVAL